MSSETIRAKSKQIAMEVSDPREAVDILDAFVARDKVLSAIARRFGCLYYIHNARHEARASTKGGGTTLPSYSVDDALRVAGDYTAGYLDRYKVGDKSLGDCVRSELAHAMEQLRAKQAGMAFEQSFLDAISKKLKTDEAIVRSVWTHEDAEALRERLTIQVDKQLATRSRPSKNGRPTRKTRTAMHKAKVAG